MHLLDYARFRTSHVTLCKYCDTLYFMRTFLSWFPKEFIYFQSRFNRVSVVCLVGSVSSKSVALA